MKTSQLISKLKPSPTLALNQKAKALKASGKSIVNLTAGEPDVPTPEHICKAAISAIERRETRYTASSGIPELKDAAIAHIEKSCHRKYDRSEVIVTSGAKQALTNLCFALLNPGDEAIVIAPYWVSYADMVIMAGGKPVIVETDESNGFAPTLQQLKEKVTNRTRLLFLNSPCNPTGAVYPKALLTEIADWVQTQPQLIVVTDDIYECFVFDGDFYSIAMSGIPKDQLVIVNGVSKSYAMTGWRIGYALAPKELVSAMDIIQSNSTSNASSISQWAAVEAIRGDQSEMMKMKKLFQTRRDETHAQLMKIEGLTCFKPGGAFYLFPNVSAFIGRSTPQGQKMNSDLDLGNYLLDEYGLAVVPGSAFGSDGYLRLSFAASSEELSEGVKRLSLGLANLRK